MAPKHWDWYQQGLEKDKTIARLAEERDHYKNRTTPNQWGSVEQHEAGIVQKIPPYKAEPIIDGNIEFLFDDIKNGDPNFIELESHQTIEHPRRE